MIATYSPLRIWIADAAQRVQPLHAHFVRFPEIFRLDHDARGNQIFPVALRGSGLLNSHGHGLLQSNLTKR